MGDGLDLKADTFPHKGTQFYAVLVGSAVLFEICQAVGWYYHEYATYTLQSCSSIFMLFINIENAQYSVTGAQLYDKLFIRASLSTYCRQPTCINVS